MPRARHVDKLRPIFGRLGNFSQPQVVLGLSAKLMFHLKSPDPDISNAHDSGFVPAAWSGDRCECGGAGSFGATMLQASETVATETLPRPGVASRRAAREKSTPNADYVVSIAMERLPYAAALNRHGARASRSES